MRVMIAGGGTAGHVNPAIALAGALAGEEILFVGTSVGVEANLVPEAGFSLETIAVRGFDRSRPLSIFSTGAKALGAVVSGRSLVSRFKPDVVVGMGGYVSLPVCMAARTARAPVVLHEQNIVLGLAHRLSKPLAKRIAVSFEETLAQAGRKGVHTGNPVLADLATMDRDAARATAYTTFDLDPQRSTLLVFGGSLGARSINSAAAGLASLWSDRTDLQVLHITGRADHSRVQEAVAAAASGGLIYRVVEYVSAMGPAYAVADLALCRGGATTVAEICVVGVPSIVIPYPHHRDRQQHRHGKALENAGAACVLDDAKTSTETVGDLAARLLSDEARLGSMRSAAKQLGRPDAAARLAGVVREVAS